MKKIKKIPRKYFIIVGSILVIFVIWFFFIRTSSTAITYVYGKVKKGNVVVSVTGTGQVSASNQVDLIARATGNVTALPGFTGAEITKGTLIAQVDARDALIALQSAKIAFQKLTQPADSVALLQAENSFEDAGQSRSKADLTLSKSYDTAVSAMASTFVDLPDVVGGLNDLYNKPEGFLSDQRVLYLSEVARSSRDNASGIYAKAKAKYDTSIILYKNLSRSSSTSTIETALDSMYETMASTAEAIKNAKTTVEYIKEHFSDYYISGQTTVTSNVTSWTTKANSHLSDLNNAITAVQDAKNSIDASTRSLQEKKESLTKVKNGADTLDIQSQELSLRQKQYAYEDSFLRAPFDGVIAKMNIKLGDYISSGTNVGTFITKQKTAAISLNEVDASKVKLGQKVTLTFDAIDGLTIDGTVAELDLVGTVSQGVVTYGVKIAFDTQDDRIKSGMTVSTTIQTNTRESVLFVPNTAIKNNTVQVKSLTKPSTQKIETGLSNDTITEVVSGLKEGDQIVIKTTNTTTTKTKAPSLFSAPRTR